MVERSLVLPHIIARQAERDSRRVFLQHVDGPETTYGEFHEQALRWAQSFRGAGVSAGDRVCTMLPNSAACFEVWIALAWLRAIEVPINHAYRAGLLGSAIERTGAEVLVLSERFLAQLSAGPGGLPSIECLVVPDAVSRSLPDLPYRRVMSGEEFLAESRPATDLAGPDPWDVACMIYTSGTTGISKGVMVPWPRLVYDLGYVTPMDDTGPVYGFWPPFHITGKQMVYAAAKRNMPLVYREKFSPGAFWDDVRRFRIRDAVLLASMAKFLLAQPPSEEDRDHGLRFVAGAPWFSEIDGFRRRFGVDVGTGYAMTELPDPLFSFNVTGENWRSCGKLRQGPPGFEVRIVDDHDLPVASGETGELIVRTSEPWATNLGYFEMAEESAAAWRNGWFHTGDLFREDELGQFYFVDRIKDYIRVRGENISSFELEVCVTEHPCVSECAAIAVTSDVGEDDVKVVVACEPGRSLGPEELIDYLTDRLPRFMVPRYVEFVSALDKTEATSRARKAELRRNPLNEKTWDREQAGIKLPG